MRDLDSAKKYLDKYTIALVKGAEIITDTERGIAPMIKITSLGQDVRGYSVADRVVGKAVAMLFIKAGIKEVYAEIVSTVAKEVLEKYGVAVEYGKEVERISNRKGDGLCPMESAVIGCDDIERGYALLLDKTKIMSQKK